MAETLTAGAYTAGFADGLLAGMVGIIELLFVNDFNKANETGESEITDHGMAGCETGECETSIPIQIWRFKDLI